LLTIANQSVPFWTLLKLKSSGCSFATLARARSTSAWYCSSSSWLQVSSRLPGSGHPLFPGKGGGGVGKTAGVHVVRYDPVPRRMKNADVITWYWSLKAFEFLIWSSSPSKSAHRPWASRFLTRPT
jgi:hypothetical protein